MTEDKRIRLTFDEPETDWRELTQESRSVYIDEPGPGHRRARRFKFFAWGGALLLLLVLGGGTLYYFYGPGKKGDGSALDGRLAKVDLDTLKDRYFIPEGTFSEPLQRAIGYYRSNDRSRAKIEFENFIASSAQDKEKSIALVFLGVMAMETDRMAEAKHQLLRALRFDKDSVPAYVNLAIVERRSGNLAEAKDYAKKARELAPNDNRVAILLGNVLADSQDLAGAIDTYKEGIKSTPNDPVLYYNLALSLVRNQQYEEAILYFSKTIEAAGPGQMAVSSHAHLGQIYFSRANYELAADHLKKASDMAPDNGKYSYNLGVAYLRLKRENEALDAFKRALSAGANQAEVLRAVSEAFLSMKQNALAVKALERALYLNPDDVVTLFQLGDLQFKERDFLGAADAFRKIVNITPGDSNTEEALLKLGAVYSELERYNEAVAAIEKVVQMNPRNARAHYMLGLAYSKSGHKDLAAQAWQRAIAAGTDGKIVLERADERTMRLALAELYRRQGAYDLALREYRMVQSMNKKPPVVEEDPELDLQMGKTYLALHDSGNAAKAFESAAASRTASTEQRKDAFLNQSIAYSETGNPDDLDRAKASANKAGRMDPNDPMSAIVRAGILMKTDSMLDREKAIEILSAVTNSDVDPKTASKAYDLLGTAYYKNGEFARALRAFDYAVQLDPANREAYENQRAAANAYEKEKTYKR
ncbi:MAG: tetratricopeptide repeat protein [Spirochaetia bacterium]|nr:tetratricopeptide repeat protein [Spirochaetia bacterium]